MIHFKSSNPNSLLDQHMVREGKNSTTYENHLENSHIRISVFFIFFPSFINLADADI